MITVSRRVFTTEGRDRAWVGANAPSRGEGRARPVRCTSQELWDSLS